MTEAEIVRVLIEHARGLGIDAAKDAMVRKRLAQAATLAAAELAETGRAEVNLPFLSANAQGPVHLQLQLPIGGPAGPRHDPRVKLS